MVFIRFLKSNDQKNQKNIVFLYDSEEAMLRNIHKNNGFSGRYFSETDEKNNVFFFLVSGRFLGSRREGQEFLKNQKMFCKVSEK